MKSLLFKPLVLLLLTLYSYSTYAQAHDYVITRKGDTLKCLVSLPLFGSPKYQIDTTQPKVKIQGDEIKEYYISRKKLRSRYVYVVEREFSKFLTVLENGKICLYEDVIKTTYRSHGATAMTTNTTTTSWYIAKGVDTVHLVKTNTLIGGKSGREDMFADMLKDNSVIYQQYKTDNSFSFAEIRNIVHLYNTGEPYKEDKKFFEFEVTH